MIHEEMSSPDIRYALLLLAFVIFIVARIWQSGRHASSRVPAASSESATRALIALGCGFTAEWIVWLYGSGNSRYFIPMACVAAVLAVALLFRLLANHTLGRNGILLALFAAQGTQLVLGTDYRWNPAPWGGPWFDVEIPERLASQPNLYLSIGMTSNSYIAPFFPKGSGMVNFAGGYPLGPGGATASHLRAMIARNAPHVRVLVSGDRIHEDSESRAPRRSDVDDTLRMYGLRVDMSDCETITVRGLRPTLWRPLASSLPGPVIPSTGKLRYTNHLASCHLVADTSDKSREMAARRAVDVVLDRLEDACPALFQPPRPQTEYMNHVWMRSYGATDLTAWVAEGEVKFIDATRDVREISVGREEAWAKAPLAIECGRRHGIYFARLLQPGP